MRIAVVAPLVAPLDVAQARGSHALLIDVARGLGRRGHDVRVFAAGGSSVPGLDIEGIEVEPEMQAATIAIGRVAASASPVAVRAATSAAAAAAHDAAWRGFERLYTRVRAWRPEVVSQHAFDAAAIDLAAGLRILHTLHLPPIVPEVVAACRRTSAPLAAVSEASRRDWARASVATGLLRNGVPDFLAGLPWPALDDPPTAVVAGRISPEKGTGVAIRAALAAGLRPLVVGPVYDAAYFADEVEPLLASVDWRPPVPRTELARIMAAASVTLMPVAWDEPFGLVAAEAQMAGCPVVGYRRGALPEVVRDGIGGLLVEPGDEAALVRAVRAAGSLDRAAIRADAQARLSFWAMLEGYERALNELAARDTDGRGRGPALPGHRDAAVEATATGGDDD